MIASLDKDVRASLALSDLLAFFVAAVSAVLVRMPHGSSPWHSRSEAVLIYILFAALWYLCLRYGKTYDPATSRWEEMSRISKVAAIMTMLVAAVAFFSFLLFSRLLLVIFFPLLVLCTIGMRQFVPALTLRLFGYASPVTVVVLGKGTAALQLVNLLKARRMLAVERLAAEANLEHQVRELVRTEHPSEIVFADPRIPLERIMSIRPICEQYHVGWQFVAEGVGQDPADFDNLPLVGGGSAIGFVGALLKRAVDVVLSSMMIILFGPVMFMIWAIVKLTSRGPGFIVQRRVGQNCRPFDFYKFRSMYMNNDDTVHRQYVKEWIGKDSVQPPEKRDGKVFKIVNDSRVTPIGRLLRRYSLDELPQVFNVLKGDMSLVGPRPSMPYELGLFQDWHMERFKCLPGITGLWQVSGRNRLTFDEMVKLDIEYANNWSMRRDFEVLLKTIPEVIQGSGH